jgi:hypothetical protein
MGQQKLLFELSSYYTVLSFELILVNFYLMLFHALFAKNNKFWQNFLAVLCF